MTRPSVRLFRTHRILGRIAWCPTCAGWWPYRSPFWQLVAYREGDVVHSAARNPYTRRTSGESGVGLVHQPRKVRQATLDRVRSVLFDAGGRCLTPSCPVVVPPGRGWCHGCEHRMAGPLTVQRLVAIGVATAHDRGVGVRDTPLDESARFPLTPVAAGSTHLSDAE